VGDEVKILIWWVLFAGTHIIGSSVPLRTFLIGRLTLAGFKALYSLVAFATFIPLCVVYANAKHAGALMFRVGPNWHLITQALMLLALIVLVQGQLAPNPMTSAAEMRGRFSSSARGIQRITRHPQNAAFILFGLAHCLINPYVGDWIFFGGFVVYGVISAPHQDRRVRATGPDEARTFLAETSFMPFAATLSGRQRLAPREFSIVGLVVSVVVFLILRQFHGQLFGGFGF
jgi:uncharacterized membrane protein